LSYSIEPRPGRRDPAGTRQAGIKATVIGHDPNASDLVGVATQANGYDLIVAS